MKTNNRIAMTKDLHEEWFNHASAYTIKVYFLLKAKRRIKEIHDHETVEDIRIKTHSVKDKQRILPILKDIHLLEAAILTDKIIFSLDDKARNNFNHLYNCVSGITDVCWLNPSIEQEEVTEWLIDTKKYDPTRFIVNYHSLVI
ncbi:hypothetical protein [Bacillus pumilus]|uniref:hypothetical protein n=1 Tax=Bacillus pumilus TaxID=1408 RepID=UPI0025A20FBD|nr:hypothetical protein [Bacillus pumilus]